MPEISTQRLRLRPMTVDDHDAARDAGPDAGRRPWPNSPNGAEDHRYAIELAGAPIGGARVCIRDGGGVADIGFVVRPDHRGHGYASEAAAALVDHVVEHHGVHRVEAGLAPDDVASMRVVEAIGMTFEALAHLAFGRDGVWEDDLRYAMTATERSAWRDRNRAAPDHVELVEITPDDAYLWGRLRTHHSEQRFVATMPLTWRDALFPEVFEDVVAVPWMRGVLADGERTAFVMTSTTHGTRSGHYLWRMLVDRTHQRRGIGRRALGLLFEHLRLEGVPRLYTSCGQGVGTPQPFYEALGFVATGELLDDEVELVLEL